ncbi:hypothetical protein Q428_13660 [Fervidicella metallireducens AeB]|uniref:IrrE N-terminal-like domain-containing protein n=1 Tax=Fervidicella metallireducens AeB TaxID=1403537 RepID=A0A017RSD7_9CLOT|nr:ImmA/IrrE family metallo-endopeptidase [Fervidicella metallireducens]EYE87384.1 hypothetical protein Q428_13660 [Fervidicella metallireducens AeB]
MNNIASFKDFIESMFYNQIFKGLSNYVEDNPDKLECSTYHVKSPDEAELYDFRINAVDIIDSPENLIIFDLIVSAELKIAETVRRNRRTGEAEQWFIISCEAELEDGIKKFNVINISIYDNNRSNIKFRSSENLIPIIKKEQLDYIAEIFLKKYYPEALEKPMKVLPKVIVERMGLELINLNITKTSTAFGQIVFDDCEIEYFDTEKKVYAKRFVKKGTIVVDPKNYFMRNLGSVNNTIIHECVHWEYHRKYFDFIKLYNKYEQHIICNVNESSKPIQAWSPYEIMEWQANVLAPRILMPAKQTKEKIEELIEKNKKLLPNGKILDIYESVIYELADFFGVSKLAAKIRMLDLGYYEAEGVYIFIDNHYVTSYISEQKALKRKQTYTIGIQDALFLYATDLNFKKTIELGNYIYVDNHFCINDSKYINLDETGVPKLTDYAREHMEECCLIFEFDIKNNDKYGLQNYSENLLFRSLISNKIAEINYDENENNEVKKEHKIIKILQ